jgi:nucleoside-diphosphate-sugar epimerase
MCRKVAQSRDGDEVEIWGDGSAIRSYTYVDDMVDGIHRLTESDLQGPTNIGSPQYINVRELVRAVAQVAGKKIGIRSIPGPVGVQSRAFSNAKIEALGWKARYDILKGLEKTYPWVAAQAHAAK